jgi:hypothetical protein
MNGKQYQLNTFKAMKNKLLLFSLVILLATLGSLSPVQALPNYVVNHNFNADQNGWVSSAVTSFEYGRIANLANPFYLADANNLYFGVDLGVTYGSNLNVNVVSPVLDFSTVVSPVLSFDYYAQAFLHPQLGGDGAYLEYNIGNGWVTLGSIGDMSATNWYDALMGWEVAQENFGTMYAWNNSNSTWKTASIPVPQVANQANVSFRFVFRSSSSNAGEGFGFDNFMIEETAPANEAEVFAITAPVSTTCSFSATETITATIKNTGTSTMTSGTYRASYSLDNITYNDLQVINSDLTGGSTINVNFNNVDLTANSSYTIYVKLEYGVAFGTEDIHNVTVTQSGIDPISTFAFNETFAAASNYFGTSNGSDALVSYDTYLKLAGNVGTAWTTSSEFTTEAQAFAYANNLSSAFTCNVNASSLGTVDLLFDFAQVFGFGTNDGGKGYTFFRVLVNGTPVADVYGKSLWQANSSTLSFERLRFNLDAFAGTNFVLTLQAANKRSNDFSAIKNLTIRQRPADDLAIVEIVSPETSCGLTATDAVTIKIQNRGTSAQTAFPVYYSYGVTTVNENYVGTLLAGQTANYTFTATADFSNGLTIDAGVNLGGDGDASNDDITGYVVTPLGTDISGGEASYNFNVTNGNFVAQDVNNNGTTWVWSEIGTDLCQAIDYLEKSANDWLFSDCVTLGSSIQQYQVTFRYKTQLNSVAKSLTVYLTDGQSNTAAQEVLLTLPSINTNSEWVYVSKVFTVATPGVHYIAFKATGAASNFLERIMIDDVFVREFVPTDLSFSNIEFNGFADISDCEIVGPVTVSATLTNVSGGTIYAGDQIEVRLSKGLTTLATEFITLASDFVAGTDFVHTFATTVDLSAVGTHAMGATVVREYDPVSNNDGILFTLTTYGYPSNLSVTGLAAGYCLNAPAVELSLAYTPASGTGYVESVTGQNITGNAMAGYYYNPTNLTNSAITYTVTDDNGCSADVDYTVVVTNPSVDLGADVFSTYNDLGTTVMDAGNGYTYAWSTGATTQSILASYFGTYEVTVTDFYCTDTDSKVVGQEEQIDLRTGWGYFSSLMNFTTPTTLASVIDPASPIIVKTISGLVYWPSQTIDAIGNLTVGTGYQYKVPADYTISINGLPVQPELTPLSLSAGYNFLGYLRQTASPATTELASIWSNIFIMKDQDGKVIWPAFNVNMIGSLTPGQAYKLQLTDASVLTYSANSPSVKAYGAAEPTHYRTSIATGSNMTVGIPYTAWNIVPSIGDEVGVFSTSGVLVGSSVFTGENIAIAVMGNDLLNSEKSALAKGEGFVIKVWNHMSNEEVTCAFNQEIAYQEDAVVVLEKIALGQTASTLSLSQNMPNPASALTQISFYLPESGDVKLALFNILGEEVAVLANSAFAAGEQTIQVDTRSLASGSYIYKLTANGQTQSKQMMIK